MSRTIIGVDIRVLALGKHTGVEEYVLNLLPRMIAQHPEITFRLFYSAVRKQKLDFPWLRAPNVKLCDYLLPNRLFLFPAHVLFGWPKVDRMMGGCDVFWSPHLLNVALSPEVRHVVTVHDLAFERHPEFFTRGKLWWHKTLMVPQAQLARADAVIAVSHSTANDVERLYGIQHKKIHVVHPGVGEEFHPIPRVTPQASHIDTALYQCKQKYGLPDHFILYFGTIEPRKNLVGLIQAFELFKNSYKLKATSYKLVIAGAKGWLFDDVYAAAKKSPYASDITFTGFIAEEDKPALYNLADVFVYPSFFEGFGFPALEAIACGVAVVTSNRASLPEVVGNAAIMVNPWRPGEIVQAISTLLAEKNARRALITRGIERAKKFSWNAAAIRTMDVLLRR